MIKKIMTICTIVGYLGCTQSHSIQLQGRLAMKGSSTHTYLSIYDKKSQKSYKIKNKEQFNLLQRQNQTVTLEATLLKEAKGPGFPAEIEVLKVK
ncbi:MAG: hypothetical protein DSZ09_05720 [Sulfurovum sp.]|nr:MAG: hypothetical protein DSZ09_05720 [Sulfurovum sp.]